MLYQHSCYHASFAFNFVVTIIIMTKLLSPLSLLVVISISILQSRSKFLVS